MAHETPSVVVDDIVGQHEQLGFAHPRVGEEDENVNKWVWAAILVGATAAYAQRDASQLRLQVLSGRTGKPVTHVKVVLMGSDGMAGHAAAPWTTAMTDGEGFVVVPEKTPLPKRLHVWMETYHPCSKTQVRSFAVEKIAASGVVSENSCKPRITLYPQAGTLVLFVRPETLLERMRR